MNAWIAHRLFSLSFTTLQSNESAFIAISRFFLEHWNNLRWFPWFDGGMPIENAYQPVLPALTALLSALSRWPVPRAYHVILALAYCLGPVTLFWFVLDWSESTTLALLSGLFYSLISPAAMAFPILRIGASRIVPGGIWMALRLFNLVYFGEDPHIVALAILPVALLFLRRTIVRRDRASLARAVVSCAAVVMTNAFGAPVLALGALCIVIALRRGVVVTLIAALTAWCLGAPWLPPALIATIQRNAWTARGQYGGGPAAYIAGGAVLLLFGLVWLATARLPSSFDRFVWLFAIWMCAFPVAYFAAGVTLVPQPHRYQLESEMGLCLVLAWLCWRIIRAGKTRRNLAIACLTILFVNQTRIYLNTAHTLIKPFDISSSVEYKATQWIDRNLPGQRTMLSGDAAWVFNVFSDNPQMSAGHEPTAPNFIQQIAVYQIYSGTNAGARDAEISILWLKAFGNQAVTVPGPATREVYKPFVNAGKFAGVLPVLWEGDGDTIYQIPQRSHSLAHVIPATAVANRPPANGIDVEPLRQYVAALDDPQYPAAEIDWQGQSQARIRARIGPGQVLSLQETWDPGWRARLNGQPRPLSRDGLGLIVIDPQCAGYCEVDLSYGVTPEGWFCRILSGLACVALLWLLKVPDRPLPFAP